MKQRRGRPPWGFPGRGLVLLPFTGQPGRGVFRDGPHVGVHGFRRERTQALRVVDVVVVLFSPAKESSGRLESVWNKVPRQ